MQAWVCRRYGGVDALERAEAPDPVPKENEVLVRIYATTVTAADWRVRTLEIPKGLGLVSRLALGVSRPRQPILGTELAGVVEAVGARVTRYRVGDEVFAFPGGAMGAHAELRAIAEDGPIAPKPANLTMEEAASLSFGGASALDFLRKADLKSGERVLVVGASGNVGTALVQLAKRAGAHVTGVASGANESLVRGLGADRFIDYTRESYLDGRDAYDVIADTVGVASYRRAKGALAKGGRHLTIAGDLGAMLAAAWAPLAGHRVVAGPAAERPEYVRELAELAASGAYRPVVDRVFGWDAMREAHAYVATRRKRGSAVVRAPRPT